MCQVAPKCFVSLHHFCLSLVLLSHEQPGSVRDGHRRLQDASSAQMPQLPVPDHAEVLERRPGPQAGLPVAQGATGQQQLRAGVNVSRPPQGGGREPGRDTSNGTSQRPGHVYVFTICKNYSLFFIQKSDDLLFLLKL